MRFQLLAVVTTAVGLLSAVHGEEVVAEPLAEIPVGKIAFVTSRSFGSEGTIQVTGREIHYFGSDPAFSQDGSVLIYAENARPNSAFYIRDLEKNLTEIVELPGLDAESPSISPDKTKLVYTVWTPGRKSAHLFISDRDGANARQVTEGNHFDWLPTWSPDGSKIAFETTRDGERQIYLMDADGSNQTALTKDGNLCHSPAWFPDGSRLAFMGTVPGGASSDIFTIRVDGTDKKAVLVDDAHRESEPACSPDGNWIAFTRCLKDSGDGPMDIWCMKPDGSEQRQITQNPKHLSSYSITWSK